MAFSKATIKTLLGLTLCISLCVLASSEHIVKYTAQSLNGTDVHVDNHTDHDDNHTDNGDHEIHGVEIVEWKFYELREHFIFTIVVLLAGLSKVGEYSEVLFIFIQFETIIC